MHETLAGCSSVVKTVALVGHTNELLHAERHKDVDSAA